MLQKTYKDNETSDQLLGVGSMSRWKIWFTLIFFWKNFWDFLWNLNIVILIIFLTLVLYEAWLF